MQESKSSPRNATPPNREPTNHDSQERYLSQEVMPTYVQSDLSKKGILPQTVNETENLYLAQNELPHKLSPSEKVEPVYPQPDLSKKKRPHPSVLSTSNESPPPFLPHIEDEDYI